MINIPTFLTLLRILAIPVIVLVYFLPVGWAHPVAGIVFALAAFTDWLDGYLARSLSQMTKLGAFLDPVADKVLVAIALVMVVGQHLVPYLALPAAIIVGREIIISGLREWMAELGKRTSVAVIWLAKVKTLVQMVSLVLLLWYRPGHRVWIVYLGTGLLYLAALLTLWSMVAYIKAAWPDLTISRES